MLKRLRKSLCTLALLLSATSTQASIIQVGFSGTIETNNFDIPVGTIISAGFSYDKDTLADYVVNGNSFAVFDIFLNMFGESVTNDLGYMRVNSDSLEFQSGPYLSLGGNSPFSDFIKGIEIRGIGFDLVGGFIADELPTDPATVYGLSGTFFVNRSNGALFDVNSPDLLQTPVSPDTDADPIPEPSMLFLAGLGMLIWSRRKAWH